MVTRSKNHSSKPKQAPDGNVLYPMQRALSPLLQLTLNLLPFTEASKFSHWRSTMNAEFDALL